MARNSRERMVVTAASLIGSRGAGSTSLADILAKSQAPRGSIYHHFPGGKRELVQEAMRWTSAQLLAHQRQCRVRVPAAVLEHFVDFFRKSLNSSGCEVGCPIAAVILDTSALDVTLKQTGRTSFRSWVTLLTHQLEAVGTPRRRARDLATMALSSVEGAVMMCRAEGNTGPLELVSEQLRQLASPPV